MRAARMLALLVLAAVFSMHGLQCITADPGGGAHADMASMPSALMHAPEAAVMTIASAATALPSDGGLHGIPGSGVTSSSHQEPDHSAAHALALCLAVLLVGALLVVALILLRRALRSAAQRSALSCVRSWWASTQPLRPPDLASLCLLRI